MKHGEKESKSQLWLWRSRSVVKRKEKSRSGNWPFLQKIQVQYGKKPLYSITLSVWSEPFELQGSLFTFHPLRWILFWGYFLFMDYFAILKYVYFLKWKAYFQNRLWFTLVLAHYIIKNGRKCRLPLTRKKIYW